MDIILAVGMILTGVIGWYWGHRTGWSKGYLDRLNEPTKE